ncbi:hypothetical protein [Photobacterium profundum]|uniref:hypothetical protein n=1 Tax=Photobacterium profundum TaxID=74109 RepID=UPI003D0D0CE5
MALPIFPDGVKLAMDYGEDLDLGIDRTEMEGGIPKQRPKFSMPIMTRRAKVVATTFDDKVKFDHWYINDIKGASWFTYKDPIRSSGTLTARFQEGKLSWHMVARNIWEANVVIESIGLT